MLTVVTHDPQGHPVDVRWYCDACEALEIAEGQAPQLRNGERKRIGPEEFDHSDTLMPPHCYRCEPSRVVG